MKIIPIVLALLCSATFAQAEPLKVSGAVLIAAAGQGLDATSTIRFLSNDSGCTEANPKYGPHPSAAQIILPKVALVGAVYLTQRLATATHKRWLIRASQGLGYYAGAQGFYSGARNLALCGL